METSFSAIFLILVLLFIACIYKTITKRNNYFQLRGIAYNKPLIFFGNMWEALIDHDDYESVVDEFYRKFRNEK